MSFLRDSQTIILVVLIIVVVGQFVLIFGLKAQFDRQTRTLRRLFSGPSGDDLQAILQNSLDESRRALAQSESTETRFEHLEKTLGRCVQHIGVVRYDAYDNTSGAQSFSAALLDGEGNGVVITGLVARNESRCYGKAIVGNRAEQTLSEEENAALAMALSNNLKASASENAASAVSLARGERGKSEKVSRG